MSECKYWGFYVCCSNFGNQERGSKKEPHAVSQVPPVCSNTNMVRKTKRRSNNPPMHIDIHGTVCTCSTLWENRGDYWEISDVPLQITLMNISQLSPLSLRVRRIVYENALALIGTFFLCCEIRANSCNKKEQF